MNIEIKGIKSNQYRLGVNGMEQLQSVYLHKGTKIIAHGYAMSIQNFVIYDDKMNAVEICNGEPNDIDEYDLDNYFGALQHIDDTCLPISKVFGIGFYYDESGELISDDIIRKSLERANNIEKLKREVQERKERESKELTERLIKEYSYLKRCNKYDHNTCGENIRAELKRKFPTTKFSVRYKSFSGGNEYSISWTDGATTEQVEEVVNKYQDTHPDEYSCGDYWDYKPSNFNNLFGGVSYIMTHRNISEYAIRKTRERFADLTEENMQEYNYGIEGSNSYAWRGNIKLDDMINWLARSIDWQEKREERKQTTPEVGNYEILDYSEKSFAVVGDTKSIKDDLKSLGGRFNMRLSCGAGWIFPKTKLDNVKQFLNV